MADHSVAHDTSAAKQQSAEPSVDRPDVAMAEIKTEVVENGNNGIEGSSIAAAQVDADANEQDSGAKENSAPPPKQETEGAENKGASNSDGEEKDGDNATTGSAAGSAEGAADASGKSKSRRKSGVPEHRGKKLNRKGSQAKQLHLDAKPGDYYLVKLKGYPTWPAIICDQDMLPQALLASRPQTAARLDGSYREEYADGGKRVRERTYPVMFMATNEFAWTPNTDLREFDVEESRNFPTNRAKNLNLAHQLAVEQHPLSHWKKVLNEFQESLEQQAEQEKAKQLAKEEKEKKKAAKKSKAEGDVADDDDDDTAMDLGADGDAEPKKKKSNKKRELADGDGKSETPANKKIKLINSSKSNGTPASSAKPKSEKKEPKAKKSAKKEAAAEPPKPVEPELTPEELRAKKEREILFLRHKLQKGLLSRDNPPEESQMAQMAEYINKLEGYPDLEVSIIKTTKINKVLKNILRLDAIPKEAEFNFKIRSTSLLAKWNHILENAPKEAPAATNGLTNGDAKGEHVEKQEPSVKEEASNGTNGIKKEEEAPKADSDVEMKDVPADAMNESTKDKTDTPATEETKDTAVSDVEAAA